mmetsp:Transcript_18142/g.23487  ORF Transcript_18142/g.23487 Transcript_18142/m.23487 type:complete len:140 (-) Transcript_18142:2618-3037(-)
MLKFSGFSCLIGDLNSEAAEATQFLCQINRGFCRGGCVLGRSPALPRPSESNGCYLECLTDHPAQGAKCTATSATRCPVGTREMVQQTLQQAYSQEYSGSARCVRTFDDSLDSAIRITYRISLRSSSLWEPRHPPLKVV